MREQRYEELGSELRQLYPLPRQFVSIDPGNTGALVAWEADGAYAFHRPIDRDLEASAMVLSDVARYHGARLWVVENQYVARDPRMSLQMAQRIGLLLGMAAERCGHPERVHIVWVQPVTWQVILAPGQRVKRKELERRSLASCQVEMPGLNKAQRTGVAAAFHIGRWWKRRMRWEGKEESDGSNGDRVD